MFHRLFETVRRMVEHNLGLKVLSAVLAALCFYAIHAIINLERTTEVAIDVKAERGIAILEKDPPTLTVTFRGALEDIRALETRDLRAVVRPRATDPRGSETITVTRRDIEGASGLRVVRIQPTTVTLQFDREMEKRVAIEKPRVVGTPLMGKVELEYEPQSVVIRGPKRRLEMTAAVLTEPVDVTGRFKSFSRTVRVIAPEDAGVSRITPPEVTVRVNLITDVLSLERTNVAVQVVSSPGFPSDIRIEPAGVNLTLGGRAEVLDRVTDATVKVFVDCTGISVAGVHELPVQIYLPPDMELTCTATPAVVKVTVGGKYGRT